MAKNTVAATPCLACPYRCDVPSGIWTAEEYDKLVDYDRPTAEQPQALFDCHAKPENLCHGWVVTHPDSLALRIAAGFGRLAFDEIPSAGVPLFGSGEEAAEHGKRDIDAPGPEAVEMMDRLLGRYPRLQKRDADG